MQTGIVFPEAFLPADSAVEITRLLRAWAEGDQAALDELAPLVYRELRERARAYMGRERRVITLQTTALANEAWLRLVDISGVDWRDRAHFFAVAAQMMRHILVDAARARVTDKRGGMARKINLDEIPDVASGRDRELVAIDDALRSLTELDPRKAKVVELRFFGGLSVEETAAVLKISGQSVMRDWRLAKSWLMREISR
jgi:RNA polymerase sigma factor (TIGR02999 family)